MNTPQERQEGIWMPVKFLPGVGPLRAEVLQNELQIFTCYDLLHHFPFRYEDRSVIHDIRSLHEGMEFIQVRGQVIRTDQVGTARAKRFIAWIQDAGGGILECIWFRGISYFSKMITVGIHIQAYGKLNAFKGHLNVPHPEIEIFSPNSPPQLLHQEAIYSTTEKCTLKGLDSKGLRKIIFHALDLLQSHPVPEIIPEHCIVKYQLCSQKEAITFIHQPKSAQQIVLARNTLKFTELLIFHSENALNKESRQRATAGFVFPSVGDYINTFFKDVIPFPLTSAQKRVIKEIRDDCRTGRQMNRLLQGDVGSGKTMVAIMSILLALDNGFQACLMAPTEILAVQHYTNITNYLTQLHIQVRFLSGSVKGKKKEIICEELRTGVTRLVIGTHALLEPGVEFQKLGIAIIDEQHRFGVEQRAQLWKKNTITPPHVLVMTATPIPRTLAMTYYGDLDTSILDELPPGRKPIQTYHLTDEKRMQLIHFMKQEIAAGRQIYIVYPLIEESAKVDLANLQAGYDELRNYFPAPEYVIGIVHGRMKPTDKEVDMQNFIRGDTHILISTTVIEVGVDVPNASIMIIENAERFGLSQLHQLRGRVGRGSEKSYCFLMTKKYISKDGATRMQVMTSTQDGFKISEEDLKMRGPGSIMGTRQSGLPDLLLTDLSEDTALVENTRFEANQICASDPLLQAKEHSGLKQMIHIKRQRRGNYHMIS